MTKKIINYYSMLWKNTF